MDKDLEERVIKAAEYIDNGDPYKDVLSHYDIQDLIEWAAERLLEQRNKYEPSPTS